MQVAWASLSDGDPTWEPAVVMFKDVSKLSCGS